MDTLSWPWDFKIEKCNPGWWSLVMEKVLDFHFFLKNLARWRDFRTIYSEGKNVLLGWRSWWGIDVVHRLGWHCDTSINVWMEVWRNLYFGCKGYVVRRWSQEPSVNGPTRQGKSQGYRKRASMRTSRRLRTCSVHIYWCSLLHTNGED